MRYLIPILVSLCLTGCPKGGDPTPSPGPAPGYVPSAEMQRIVASVIPYESPDLQRFYADYADVVERDSEIIATTGQLRDAHSKTGKLVFQKKAISQPGLGTAIDAALLESLGNQNIKFDAEKRRKAVETFKALSWALQ